MKLFFFIPLFFISCTLTPNTGQTDSSPIVVIDPEVVKLQVRATKSEAQIVLLKKVDSINNVRLVALEKDSLFKSKQIAALTKLVTPLTPKVIGLEIRHERDSVFRDKDTKAFIAKRRADSLKVALEINKLKGASPVTQIPIMQNDIKNIKSKNLSQDKILVAQGSSIQNIEDTILVLKVDAGPDFNLNKTTGKFQISPAGMVRIKTTILPQP